VLRYLPMIVVLGLAVYCFFDVVTTDRRRFRSFGKPLWLLVVLLPVVGAILWFSLGRPRHKPRQGPDSVIQLRRPPRPVAPDDDPEFLRSLDEQARRAKREAQQPRPEDMKADGEDDSPAPA